MKEYTSIFSALEHYLQTDPGRLVYTFANDAGQLEHQLSWQQLHAKTASLSGFLRGHWCLAPGARVLLVYPPSIDFLVAFVACLRAGLIPVPVYPPNPLQADKGMDAFNRIAVDCDASLVLTNTAYDRARKMAALKNMLKFKAEKSPLQLPWATTDDIRAGEYPAVLAGIAAADDVALIQYTSGSTSAPKGVVITHGNLSHQLAFTRIAMRTDADSKAVFWVPQYHDLGLIGGILNALGGNSQLTLFSPLAFIKRPALWFDLMHAVRATHTAAPNFAFELALRKTTPEQRAQWDLSSLQVVMSAAEPVRADTSRRFLQAFAVSGLKATAFAPAYGLAEHTVAVSFNGGEMQHVDKQQLEQHRQVVLRDTADADTVELVSSGCWDDDIRLKIVDPDTQSECTSTGVGEVWVTSASKAAGYWKLPAQSEQLFNATLLGDTEHRYLRTGDLGFVVRGQLYICGRIKDLLILAGRNLYPQDIEDSVQQVDDAIRPGGLAAFAADVCQGEQTQEKLVLMVEVRDRKMSAPQLQALAQKLQRTVLERHQIACHSIVLVAAGTVLKTTSGKVRRQACRQLWMEGSLQQKALLNVQADAGLPTTANTAAAPNVKNVVLQDAPQRSGPVHQADDAHLMQSIAAQILNLPDAAVIDMQQSLIEQGMGSLAAVDFCQAFEDASGRELSITRFFNSPAINDLCASLRDQDDASQTLDQIMQSNPDRNLQALHGLRHYLLHNRYEASGFRLGDWLVRPATPEDVPNIQRLDQQEYGWLGEDAIDDVEFIAHQVNTLNRQGSPWFWLLEKRGADGTMEMVGWYIMQPTQKSPGTITSWADATDNGKLTATFDRNGSNLYLVAGGISREHSKQAHRLMVLNALSLMQKHGMQHIFACLAMPGFAEARDAIAISAEDYVQLEHGNGMPRDPFLAFFRELWAGTHKPLRLLVNGYPPDQRSGGHGVCACVDVTDYPSAIAQVIDKLAQQRHALFGIADLETAQQIDSVMEFPL